MSGVASFTCEFTNHASILINIFVLHASAVALALCQSDPVLNDGQSGGDASRQSVIDGVRKKFIEKVVNDRENNDDDDTSD